MCLNRFSELSLYLLTMAALYLYVLFAFLPVIIGGESRNPSYGCMCGPGYYVSTPCNIWQNAKCSKCPNRKFSSKLDSTSSCQDCSPCGIYSEISTPCNPEKDTVCKCMVAKVPQYVEDKFTHCGPYVEPKPETSPADPNPKSGSHSIFTGVYQNRLIAMLGCIGATWIRMAH